MAFELTYHHTFIDVDIPELDRLPRSRSLPAVHRLPDPEEAEQRVARCRESRLIDLNSLNLSV